VDSVLQRIDRPTPWRTAAIVAVGIAVLELAMLTVAGIALLGRPLAHSHHDAAATKAATTAAARPSPARPAPAPPAHAALARTATSVVVLNGNGRQGSASHEASRLQALGYRIGSTGNAQRSDYAASLVMFRPGYRGEAVRLAHDLGVRLVSPLDGLRPADLKGSQVVLVVGT
jgi:hypothetical protein